MNDTLFVALCSIGSAIAGILFSFAVYRRNLKQDGEEDGTLKQNTEYIKRRVDDVLLEQRNINATLGNHAERITRLEENTKQAHKRLDEHLKGGGKND